MGIQINRDNFYVVVPFYNEATYIEATLRALAAQTDRDYSLVLVNNGSTDASAEIVQTFFAGCPELVVHLIDEPEKGTGAASDTGFRHAIRLGATYVARTDADCLPAPDWVQNIKRGFAEEGLEFIIGQGAPRTDDIPPRRVDRLMLPLLVFAAESFGKIRLRGRQYKYRYALVAGHNLAITAQLYQEAGGFPRTRIEDVHEDGVLAENVRTLTSRARIRRDVRVYCSIRRVRKYGYLNTLLWYWDHKYRPSLVDVR